MNLSYMKIVYNILFVSFLVNFCFSQENSKKNFESKIKIVSRAKSSKGPQMLKRLHDKGYFTRKGKFGAIKKGKKGRKKTMKKKSKKNKSKKRR